MCPCMNKVKLVSKISSVKTFPIKYLKRILMLAMATLLYRAFNQLKLSVPFSAQKREKYVSTQM